MKQSEIKINSLEDNIYVICFSKPRYIEEIMKELYTDEKQKTMRPKITVMVKEMLKKGILKLDIDYMPVTSDNRANRRKYYSSPVRPIINEIEKTIKIKTKDKRQLVRFLNDLSFREFISNGKYR